MRKRFLRLPVLIAFLVCASPAAGQKLSFGVVGGRALTNDFAPIFHQFNPNEPSFRSESKSYIIGPSIEYAITRSFSVEVDALNRILHATGSDVRPDGTLWATSTYPIVTWEFPILAKFRFSVGGARFFLEGGPSLRTAGNLNGTDPSDYGATAGAGFEIRAGSWKIAPRLRYTRWAGDRPDAPATKPDQIEMLVGLSRRTTSDARPFGRYLSFGVLAGATLTQDFVGTATVVQFQPGDLLFPEGGPVLFRTRSGSKSLLIGPSVELELPARLSIEASALYRTLHREWDYIPLNDGRTFSCCDTSRAASHIWEIPVLLKYELALLGLHPFVGAGPAFRTFGASEDPRYGVTAAVGLHIAWRRLRIAPQLRYTRWATHELPSLPADQVQALVGFSF